MNINMVVKKTRKSMHAMCPYEFQYLLVIDLAHAACLIRPADLPPACPPVKGLAASFFGGFANILLNTPWAHMRLGPISPWAHIGLDPKMHFFN